MSTIRRALALPLVLFLGLALARCGGDGGGMGVDPVPTTVQIANANIVLNAIGGTATLAVTVRDQDGQPIPNPPLSFTSLNDDVATVSGSGVVTAVADGNTEIVVESGDATANADVTVDQTASVVDDVSGDGQTGTVGTELPNPLVVRVEDSQGNPVEGESVGFQVTSGGGTVSAATVASDASGEASVTWTLGDQAGQQSVRASVGAATFTFTATAEAGAPSAFVVLGDGQTGVAGFALLGSIAITVEDDAGNVVSGATVSLSASDGGSVTPATFTSDDVATIVDWTLGGGAGDQTLTVTAGDAETELTATAVAPAALADGVDAVGQAGDAGETLYYTFVTPPTVAPDGITQEVMQTVLNVAVGGGSGDRDLHVRRGSPPEGGGGSVIADCSDVGPGTEKACDIAGPPGGTWFAAVVGASGFSGASVGFSLDVQQPDLVAGPLTIQPGIPDETETVTIQATITNEGPIASGPFDWRIEVDGAPVANGTVDDLAPDQSTPVSAQDVGPFAQGQHTATLIVDEADDVEDSDLGDNTSEADFTVASGPMGTITIQKVIQSSEGGDPDNPANPSLAGFEFEIRDAGTDNVVATVTTDATGQAQATLLVGDYDVTESNSQGLTDVTQAENGRSVTDGGDNAFDWINQQPPPSMGTITIQKVIESSDGGAPNNPADPDLDGFEFEIREAGTANLVATVTTDASGQAIATLPVGDYDITESNSQGLTDVTAALNDQSVTDGGNLDVDWINRQDPPPMGMITITKIVQASDGGTADNPANPDLDGFEFEIREAGTDNVVATITTDASGEAKATLPVGDYDVTESDSQGLTDVTMAADDQAVTDGGNVEIDWINRQDPIAMGMITITKVIQASGGGAPDNPPNPALDGFEFEIREAGTANLVATVTTDATGEAKATLPVGSYDIVESDNQGLTDVTAGLNAQPVSDGGNLEVDWINRQAALGGNQAPTAVINGAPMTIPNGDGNATEVMFYGGNSTDPDGDPLTYSWSAPGGTFVGGVDTGDKVSITFPGNLGAGMSYTVTLTVDDGQGNQDMVDKLITEGSALPAAGTFNIEVVFIDNDESQPPTAAQQAAFDAAEATWESIVRSELVGINFTGAMIDIEASCTGADPDGDGTPGDGIADLNDIVDDLRIYAFMEPIDGAGGTLGAAGPCFLRNPPPGGLPAVGTMRFDTDDLAMLEANGTLNAVILHEMAHVLGLGTYWGAPEDPTCSPFGLSFLVNPSLTSRQFDGMCAVTQQQMNIDPPPDTRYNGAMAVAAWRALGGSDLDLVPIENGDGPNGGGPGNRDGHWRDVTFTTELMTAFIGGLPAPLSKLTIAGLDDLSYLVNYAPAEAFTLPDPIPTVPPMLAPNAIRLDDIRRGPIWIVDENGRIVGGGGSE